ncbi:MAG: hypothetical protein NUV91_08750, partial [Candidatus Omnitrophica bacterium]|nr:hypothetical protein [Candidatus Omnitrophota bacterium]
ENQSLSMKIKEYIPESLRKIFSPTVSFLRWWIFNRQTIEREADTGWHLYEKMKQVGTENYYKYECMIPVFRLQEDFLGRKYLPVALNQRIEKFLSDRFCYIPKRSDYFSKHGFQEQGYPNLSVREWEEYLWQNELLGFHIRGNPKRHLDMRPDKEFLFDVLSQFADLKEVKTAISSWL